MYDDNKNPGQWEVVGGKASNKTKGGKSTSSKSNGSGTKSGGHAPIIKVDELVTPLDTKYALLDPQMRAAAKRDALGLPAEKPSQKNKTKTASNATTKEVVKKKPTKEPVKEKAPKSLPEALKQINVAELSNAMSTVKARFAGARLLWLKELTSYLNNNMNVDSDPVFAGKPRDYPANSLSPELKSIITSTIQSCEDEVLNIFYDQTLLTMPSDMNRGVAVVGTKIVLQLLSYHKPDLVLGHLGRAREILTANESRVPVTLSILWVLSQSSFKDTRTGIQVWMECMLPLIGMKNYGGYVVQNVEFLTTKASNLKLAMNFLSVPDYFKFVEQVQQGTSIPTNYRREVTNLVQAITQPMISAHGSKMFTQYMRRLVAESSGRNEMCKNMASCLRADANSYETWRKDYRSNLVASSYLLKWFNDNDPKFARQSPDFQSTLQHFQTINSAFSPTGKIPLGLNNCIQACGLLMASTKPKKRSGSSKLKYLNYLLFIALVSLVYYDIRVFGEGQFVNSRLGKAAERSGLTAKALELHKHAEPYLAHIETKFIQLRDIAYVKGGELHQRAQPYLTQAGEGLIQLRDVIYRKGEELFPGIWAEADKKYQAVLLVAKEKSAVCYSKASEYAELGMEAGAQYWEKFVEWSAVYRKQATTQIEKAVELSGVYYQQARQMTIELIEKEQVQHAIKYTYDMYHKALHAVGLCSH